MADKVNQDISIGENLAKYRRQKKLTQEDVAVRLQVQGFDLHRVTISQMERGVHGIRVSVLLALAQLYGVEPGDFFRDLEG